MGTQAQLSNEGAAMSERHWEGQTITRMAEPQGTLAERGFVTYTVAAVV